jgi:hypothetical protein
VLNGEIVMTVQIERLKQVSQLCAEGRPLDAELAEWLGEALAGYLERRYRTIEEAFGLCFGQGGIPWWREEAIRTRDGALRALAETFHDGLSPCAQAREIHTAASRYAASAWRIDREHAGMPARYRGSAKQYLWQAFRSGATMPLGERQLRNILG